MFRSILCPVDFSKAGERSLEVAVSWAERGRCSLELLHVIEPPVVTVPAEVAGFSADLYGTLTRDLEALMAKRIEAVRRRVPAAVGRVVPGQVHRQILARADALGAELIVMGTSGSGAITRAILGSVADRVVRQSTIPVLLVPHEGRAASSVPKVILAPTDYSLAAQLAVTRTVALAAEVGASVEILHAFEVPALVESDARLAEGFRKAQAREVSEAHHEALLHRHVHARAREGATARTIVATADEISADLIVIAATGRGLVSALLLGGVTDRVARMSSVPVLVLRSPT